jgi:hypothetical protein
VVEFAALLASLSLLGTSLQGLQARIVEKISGSDVAALQQAVVRAKAVGVAPSGARRAYAAAPFKQPGLRYVYAAGWVAGVKNQSECALASIDVDGTKGFAVKALRADAKTMRQLRRLHLTAVQAATAFTRGFVSACGG